MKRIISVLSLICLALAGCESLESTYEDYAGDGPVRYIGKCTDISVESGWNRLTVKWTNSLDPNIEEIKISCTADTITFDTLVAADETECEIRNLADASYAVTVQGMDAEGNLSLAEAVYGRPYTYNHEAVRGFTRGISKHFFVGDNLVLFFNSWDANIIDFTLHYTGTDNASKTYQLTQSEVAKQYVLLEGVDASQTVTLTRRGRIAECPDEIDFEDYVLLDDPTPLSDFREALQERYGISELNADFRQSTELQLDYDLVSMEDILAFPNLQTLVLGKNRYLGDNKTTNLSEVENEARSLFAISVMEQLIPGFKVERYNGHYFPAGTEGITDMGDANLADLDEVDFLPTEGWTVSCSPQVADFEETDLLDDNATTVWRPLQQSGAARAFELTIDMKTLQSIDGLRIVQANVSGSDVNFFPLWANVQVSVDNANWQSVTYVEDNTLGTAPGESTLIRFSETQSVRYVKVTVDDRRYSNSLGSILGDILPFKNK